MLAQTLSMHTVTIPRPWQAGLSAFAQRRILAGAPRA